MMESIINSMANFMNKVSQWLNFPDVPWHQFAGDWNYLVDLMAPWDLIFPLSDIMIIIGLVLAVSIALMIFYTVVLIKSFVPFSGGK